MHFAMDSTRDSTHRENYSVRKLRYRCDSYKPVDLFSAMEIWNHYVNTTLLQNQNKGVNKQRESHMCEGHNIISLLNVRKEVYVWRER